MAMNMKKYKKFGSKRTRKPNVKLKSKLGSQWKRKPKVKIKSNLAAKESVSPKVIRLRSKTKKPSQWITQTTH